MCLCRSATTDVAAKVQFWKKNFKGLGQQNFAFDFFVSSSALGMGKQRGGTEKEIACMRKRGKSWQRKRKSNSRDILFWRRSSALSIIRLRLPYAKHSRRCPKNANMAFASFALKNHGIWEKGDFSSFATTEMHFLTKRR